MTDDRSAVTPAGKLLRRRPARLPEPLESDRRMHEGWLSGDGDPRLEDVVMDAVARAGDLVGGGSLHLDLIEDADTARLLARHRDAPDRMATLAADSGLSPAQALALADAWLGGGPVGVGLLTGTVAATIDEEALRGAEETARAVTADGAVERRADHVRIDGEPHGPARLMLGPDQRWYLFSDAGDAVTLVGPPRSHPARIFAGG